MTVLNIPLGTAEYVAQKCEDLIIGKIPDLDILTELATSHKHISLRIVQQSVNNKVEYLGRSVSPHLLYRASDAVDSIVRQLFQKIADISESTLNSLVVTELMRLPFNLGGQGLRRSSDMLQIWYTLPTVHRF